MRPAPFVAVAVAAMLVAPLAAASLSEALLAAALLGGGEELAMTPEAASNAWLVVYPAGPTPTFQPFERTTEPND
ncbi:MAG TPA: hypothetical protein VM889_09920 [Candidatus Thermoplasmatota archaeon]|nr:hypothetical protein [Candidatus Thermoplasmatota archaeon]